MMMMMMMCKEHEKTEMLSSFGNIHVYMYVALLNNL